MTSALNHRYPEIQGEFDQEWEGEFEGGQEAEAEAEWELEGEWESEFEGEFEGGAEFDFEAEAEFESEFESEGEGEGFVNPVRRWYPDAELMAHLSVQAARAEREEEAEAFVGALVPLAAKLVPRAARIVARNAPTLIKGASGLLRRFRRNPATRQLVAALPVILQRTLQSLDDQARRGRRIDAQTVVATLATITGRVLRSPRSRRRAIGAVRTFDRRYHRGGARGPQQKGPRRGRRRR